MKGENPLIERDMRTLKQGSDCNGKGLFARLAVIQAGLVVLALGGAGLLALATVGTGAMLRPTQGFEMLAGFLGVLEDGIIKVAHGCFSDVWSPLWGIRKL